MRDYKQRVIHRLINKRYGITPDTILNSGTPNENLSPDLLPDRLRGAIKHFKANAPDGAQVDYQAELLDSFTNCVQHLQKFDPANLASHEAQMAFWINLYNALLIHAVVAHNIHHSVKEISGFFWKAAYAVNGYRFNAFDIEYGILRPGHGHPAVPGPQFGRDDPRRASSVAHLDPRIHFALVCAANSCPPVAVYTPEDIDRQLDAAAANFINNGGLKIDAHNRIVNLSKIFFWYAPDFGAGRYANRQPLIDYILPYLSTGPVRDWLGKHRSALTVKFMAYDWMLNGVGVQ